MSQVIDRFDAVFNIQVCESKLSDGSPVFDVRFHGRDGNADPVGIVIDCVDYKHAIKLAHVLHEAISTVSVGGVF
jgi:hypothetical protein